MRWIALAAGAAVLLAGAYAGLRAVARRLERAHGRYTDARGAAVLRYTLHSARLDRDLDEVGVVPAGGDARPLLVFLHTAARAGARFGRGPVWLDVGKDDPFRAADAELAALLHRTLHVWPGGHDLGYWDAHLARYLRFYADALGACR
jgi:hypothetical protein